MRTIAKKDEGAAGYSLSELLAVICCAIIIAGVGLPVLSTMLDSYGVVMAAEQITTQLQFARMKAVSSNEPCQVRFIANTGTFRVETTDGTWQSSPYRLPNGIRWNTLDGRTAIDFPGGFVMFLPNGDVPEAGDGSAGRVRIINQAGLKVDIIVSPGGRIRSTPSYKSLSPPF